MNILALVISIIALICAIVALCQKHNCVMTGKEIEKELSKLDKIELKNTTIQAHGFWQ